MTTVAFEELLLNVPKHRIDEYFGVWAILENDFREAMDQVARMDMANHFADFHAAHAQERPSRSAYQVTPSGVAVIEIAGPMMKQESSMGGASTVAARRAIRSAAADESVRSIALMIDSPGGTVSGTSDLAGDVSAAAKIKPLYSYIQDMGASAAYWVASHGTKVFANSAEARVGSIGTFTVLRDTSRAHQNAGVDVHVVAAGEFKGMGEPGTPVTKKQLEVTQVMINELNEQFIKAVAKGRGVAISKVRSWADGRVFLAEQALAMGMIDGIQSFDETVNQLAKARKPRMAAAMAVASERLAAWDEITQTWQEIGDPVIAAVESVASSERSDVTPNVEEKVMSETQVSAPVIEKVESAPAVVSASRTEIAQVATPLQPQVASYAQLKAACYGAPADFIVAQLDANATVESAQRAWQTELVRQRDEALGQAAAAATETANVQATLKKPGSAPIQSASSETPVKASAGDPIAAWNDKVQTGIARGLTKARAVAEAAKDKELHAAYVAAVNDGR